jgi:uncharacterized pyridoxamine 5'-phosphate oxidase family protein
LRACSWISAGRYTAEQEKPFRIRAFQGEKCGVLDECTADQRLVFKPIKETIPKCSFSGNSRAKAVMNISANLFLISQIEISKHDAELFAEDLANNSIHSD